MLRTRYLPLTAVILLSAGCASQQTAYRQPPVEPALAQSPQDDRGMYLELVRQMQAQGAYYASLAHIDAFRQRFGDAPELRLLLADAQRETGDRTSATALYRGLTKTPQAAGAWHGLGLIAAAGNDHAGARQALEQAVSLEPLNITYLGDLGFALLRAGALDQARAPLAKAAELAPANTRAVSNLVLWTLLNGQTRTAETMMQRAQLPLATRQEVLRLAQTLRHSAAQPTAARTDAPIAVQTSPAALTPRPLPPGSMLQRFTPQAAPSQENTP